MALKSGFWNALPDANGNPFPKYNGDDFDRISSLIVENGVVKDGDALAVKENGNNGSSYSLKVNAGVGFINGKWFYNPVEDNTTLVDIPAPSPNNRRWDIVVVRRCNNIVGDNNRSCILEVIQGEQTTGTPTEPRLIQDTDASGQYFDIPLARVEISNINGTLSVSTTNKRHWINGYWGEDFSNHMNAYENTFNTTMDVLQQRADNWVANNSLTQGIVYRNVITLTEATNTIEVGIASYQYGVDKVEIYTNGEKEYATIFNDDGSVKVENDYVINADSTITFTEIKAVGAEILIEVTKYVDGTTDVTNAYTEIENTNQKVADLESFLYREVTENDAITTGYNYVCTGEDDNIKISKIVRAFLNENNADYKMLELKVYGTLGMTNAASGGGTELNRFKWFDFAPTNASERRVIIDFCNCTGVTIPIANVTDNILFNYGDANVTIKNISVIANNTTASTKIQGAVGTGTIRFVDCQVWITSYEDCTFASRGHFDNCKINIVSRNGNAVVFNTTGTIEVNGGEYYAYTVNGTYSATTYHAPDAATAITIMNGVRMPTYDRSGFTQTNAARINNGYINMTNCITALPNTTTTSATPSIIGLIPISR